MILDNDDPAFDRVEVGRALGHDLRAYRIAAKPQPDWPDGMGDGFLEACARGTARRPADRHVRKWLQLRLNALRRGRAVSADVTPQLLQAIDVADCPVTRRTMTHGALGSDDASVDRLNNDGAYARNNLAVMSVRANRAKGSLGYDAVYERSQRSVATDGLEPFEWLRLAALMLGPCFATRPQAAPAIPLTAPIPPYSARPAMQQIQHVFTEGAVDPAGKNRLVKRLRPSARTERARWQLERLADAVHAGLKGLAYRHDVWLAPGVMPALVEWRASLDEPSWALAGEISRQLAGARRMPLQRLATWRLDTGGRMAV